MKNNAGRRVLLLALVATSITFIAIDYSSSSRASDPQSSFSSASFRMSAQRRLERERYNTLMHGAVIVPPMARTRAIEQMNALPSGLSAGANWTFLGPQPIAPGQGLGPFCGQQDGTLNAVSGRVDSIAFGPSLSDIYVGAAGGGVWKSTDGGSTWKPLTDQQASPAASAMVVIPGASTATDTIYVGTGEPVSTNPGYIYACDTLYGQGVLKSTDGGATWTQLGAGFFDRQAFGNLAVIPGADRNHDILFAATESGHEGSSVGGFTCPPVPSANPGLAISTDGGASWTSKSDGAPNHLPPAGGDGSATDVVFAPGHTSNVYAGIVCVSGDACGNSGGVWKSTDTGNTWSQLGGGLPNTDARINLSISNDGTALWAGVTQDGVSFQGLFLSTDSGASWVNKNSDPAGCGDGGQSGYDMVVRGDTSSTANFINNVLLGLVGVYSSTDAGNSFTFIGAGNEPVHPDQHAIALNASGLFVGNDGGVFKSTDHGTSFVSSLNNGLGITQFNSIALPPSGTSLVLGGTQDNGTDSYTGNLAWNHVLGGDGGFTAINPQDTANWYQEFFAINLDVSLNSGAGWNPISNGILANTYEFYVPYSLNPNNGDILYGTDYINLSSDQGSSWAQIGTPGFNNFNPDDFPLTDVRVAPSNSAVVYATTQEGKCFVTNNATSATPTYTEIDPPVPAGLPITSIAINPTNPGDVLVAVPGFSGGGKHVFHSSNSGTNWTDISIGNGFPDVPTNKVMYDAKSPSTTYYAGTDIGVFKSTDSGVSWSNLGSGILPIVAVYDLQQNAEMIAAGTHGRGVWALMNNPSPTATPTATPTPSGSIRVTLRNNSMTIPAKGTGTGPVTKTFKIINAGKTSLSGSINAGGLPGEFSVTPIGPFGPLARGRSVTVNVTFTPTTPGQAGGQINIASSDPNHPNVPVSISADALPPVLTLSANPVKFGSVKVSRSKTITLKISDGNKGVLTGSVDSSGVSAPFTVLSGSGKFNLKPPAHVLVKIKFAPTAQGPFSATLKISSNDTSKPNPVQVTIEGSGS